MSNKERLHYYKVETIEAGQRGAYQDSFYSYKVTTKHNEQNVKLFCMGVLQKSYLPKDMPNPFAGELVLFNKITNNKKDTMDFDTEETYEYKVRCCYTG